MATVTAQDVIKKFMRSLDTTTASATAALDTAVKVASGGYFQNIGAAVNQMIADCQTVNNATKFLKTFCGINLGNKDTGAITGFDAGGSNVKTAKSVVPESGKLHDFTGNSFKVDGLTIQLASVSNGYKLSNLTVDKLTAAQKYIWQALETWWAKGALDLIAASYGNNFGFSSKSSATVKKLYVGFVSNNTSQLATTLTYPGTSGNVDKLALIINMKKFDSLIIGDANGKSSDAKTFYLDRTLAHEFTHIVMNANIQNGWKLPQFVKEGMAELTHGIDDERTSTIKSLAGNVASLAGALDLSKSTTSNAYSGGYMFLRYFAKQAAQNYGTANNSPTAKLCAMAGVTLSGTNLTIGSAFANDTLDLTAYPAIKTVNAKNFGGGMKIVGNKFANSIVGGNGSDSLSGGKGSDTLKGGVGNDKLYGGSGNDSLDGSAGSDILSGGTGNDTLFANTGNDTLSGGKGKDVFIYSGGNDIISDYAVGDTIRVASGTISETSLVGKNVVFTIGNGSLTVKNAKNKTIALIDSAGESSSTVVSDRMTVTDSTASPVTVAPYVKIVDASARTTAVKIVGNGLNNSIVGGSGDDTLSGGSGNDSLWGGNGSDTFIYAAGDGKDIIYGFGSDDLLKITGAFSASYSKSKNSVAFKVGSGSVTLKNFGATTTFHVNDTTYRLSGGKLTAK